MTNCLAAKQIGDQAVSLKVSFFENLYGHFASLSQVYVYLIQLDTKVIVPI